MTELGIVEALRAACEFLGDACDWGTLDQSREFSLYVKASDALKAYDEAQALRAPAPAERCNEVYNSMLGTLVCRQPAGHAYRNTPTGHVFEAPTQAPEKAPHDKYAGQPEWAAAGWSPK